MWHVAIQAFLPSLYPVLMSPAPSCSLTRLSHPACSPQRPPRWVLHSSLDPQQCGEGTSLRSRDFSVQVQSPQVLPTRPA